MKEDMKAMLIASVIILGIAALVIVVMKLFGY